MTDFRQLSVLLGVICSVCSSPQLLAQSARPGNTDVRRPNIIFILTDDQRWDALGYAGNDIIKTPEMDALARQGSYFSHAMVSTPICSASRASIFSGLYERTHRYSFQTGPMRREYMEQSYPRLLRAAGYHTGFFGKFGVNYTGQNELFNMFESYDRNGRFPDRRGYYYKKLKGKAVHLTRYTGEKALEFIAEAPTDRPFCLSLSFSAPHAHDNAKAQYFWQETSDHLYQDMRMPGPKLGEDAHFNALPQSVREGFNRRRWHWRYDTPEKYQHSVKGYYRMIHGIDLEIGKIRTRLKERGLDQNTVIILMGDNGYFLGERQLAGKWLMFDNSIRVPLIVFDPRVRQHRDVTDMALNVDVPCTLLDLAGVKRPESYHGKSLMPLVSGQANSLARDAALLEHLWEFENIPPSEGIRTVQWKYFRYVNDKSEEALYSLVNDPQEIRNLAGLSQHANTLTALRRQCDQLIQAHTSPDIGVPSGLMVEFIRKPEQVDIVDALPEYSWIVPKEAVLQKGFQILVASSRQKIDQNLGDVWDSHQVRSRQSANIEHGGDPLHPHTSYFWKLRIWDQDNRLSDYSAVQGFKTGAFDSIVSSPNAFQIEKIAPIAVRQTGTGSYFVDFGKDAFGTLELSYKTDRPETLTIRLGEKLKHGKIDRKPGGTIRYQALQLKVSPEQSHYILELPADKRNTNEKAVPLPKSLGVITPFRYAEIENAQQIIRPNDLKQRAVFHYFEEDQSHFSSSDEILDQVYDLCKYSMKATSATGLYIDGDRERIPYEADAYINQLSHYGVDREYAMGKQTIEWFMKHPTWPTEWLLHTALMMQQDYYHSGDTELIKAYYELLKHKTLMALAREDGLISTRTGKVSKAFLRKIGFNPPPKNGLRDIVDWPPGQKDTGWKLARPEGERDGYDMVPINTMVNCFFYQNMVIMAEFATILDKTRDVETFQYMAAKVKRSINTKLFDQEKGIYVDGEGSAHASLHANMMPLAFDMVPKKHLPSVAAFVKSRGMACSVYGAQYLLEGLYRAGEAQYALELMRAQHDRSWYNMIKLGSTITLEAWDMKYKPNSDWNHAWGAAPGNIIPRYLWGIQPKTPGFSTASIQPQMADLAHSRIEAPTLLGPIRGTYRRVSQRVQTYDIELPANMVAEFSVQGSSEDVLTLNGQAVNLAFGSIRLHPGVNQIEIRINSF
jgi:alpha-L-rhamnosidase